MNATLSFVDCRVVVAGNYPQQRRCCTKKGHVVGAEIARLTEQRSKGCIRPQWPSEILAKLECQETRKLMTGLNNRRCGTRC